MRTDDDMMQAPFDIAPVKFKEIMDSFNEIAAEEGLTDADDFDLGELPELEEEEYVYDDDAWAYDEVDELTEWHDYDPYC